MCKSKVRVPGRDCFTFCDEFLPSSLVPSGNCLFRKGQRLAVCEDTFLFTSGVSCQLMLLSCLDSSPKECREKKKKKKKNSEMPCTVISRRKGNNTRPMIQIAGNIV